MKSQNKPGQPAKQSGIYQQVGPRGGRGVERTVVAAEPFPPTDLPGSHYRLVRPAHNGAGKGGEQ